METNNNSEAGKRLKKQLGHGGIVRAARIAKISRLTVRAFVKDPDTWEGKPETRAAIIKACEIVIADNAQKIRENKAALEKLLSIK